MDNPEDITQEHIDFANSADKIAASRIPAEGYMAMGVNDYIASLTNLKESSEALGLSGKTLERSIGKFTYLRDNYGVKTVSDVQRVLSAGRVDPSVVDLWIEEGFAVNPLEFDAIKTGYPDKVEALQSARDKTIDTILNKKKEE